MQFNTYVASIEDIQRAAQVQNLKEVLIEPTLLARQGSLAEHQVLSLSQEARRAELRPVLVWDILMTERALQTVGERLLQWDLSSFAAIRVCDVGVGRWVEAHVPDMPLQLTVEHGNHNLDGLIGWCEFFKGKLERLILSIELPESKLIEYSQQLPVPCEVLGVGQILLFYSPRSLLTTHGAEPEEETGFVRSSLQTDEHGDRQFPTLETLHGTMMYLDKDQFILDQLENLTQAGFHTVCLDLRHLGRLGHRALEVDQICAQIAENPKSLKENWPRPARSPFFRANRTTTLFPRLKSKITKLRDETCVAECIGSQKGEYGIFRTLQPFDRSRVHSLVLPSGEVLMIPNGLEFRDLEGKVLGLCDAEKTITMDWIRKLASGAILIRQ